MNNKEINRESGRIFSALLLPNWAVRSQEDQEDYGVDFEIEIMTPDDKASGFIFKVQLKGTSGAKYDKPGRIVFSDASVARFQYYCADLQTPMLFVICDVIKKKCFWTEVQGNQELESALAEAVAADRLTFTLKVPASQEVAKSDSSAAAIIKAIQSAFDAIHLRRLRAISPESIRRHIGREPDIEATERQFRLGAGIAAIMGIQTMLDADRFEEARVKATNLLESRAEALAVRLYAGVSLVHVCNVQTAHDGALEGKVTAAKVRHGVASRMLEIARVRDGDVRMRRYARIYARAARMLVNGRTALALAISERVQAGQGVTLARPITHLQRLELSELVSRDFLKLNRAIYALGANSNFSVMPHALSEVAECVQPFVWSLRFIGSAELADAYVDALFDLLPFCLAVVRRMEKDVDIVNLIENLGARLTTLANTANPDAMNVLVDRFERAMDGDPQFACRGIVLATLRDFVGQARKGASATAKPSMAEIRSFYVHQATALGVNLDDPNDKEAQIVRIGLADLDPTRVLRNCQHMHVLLTSRGVYAEVLGLLTAGSKRLICLKHGHSVEGLDLDKVYSSFVKMWPLSSDEVCCDNCPDQEPHPEAWQWTEDWQAVQHAEYLKSISRADASNDGVSRE